MILMASMHSANTVRIEIAAHCIESALAAQAGGADRVELFSNPFEGGVTPSEGLIAGARRALNIPLHVMIRPRGGDFHYSNHELEVMRNDIAVAQRLGANGVVFGLVNVDGMVDVVRTRELVNLAKPLAVTFHRAFDLCRDLHRAFEDVISCGADRVLTSGGEETALKGIPVLAKLVDIAACRIGIAAAGGIRPENAQQIVRQTGVQEVHAGLRSRLSSPMRFRNEKVRFGTAQQSEYERMVVTEQDIRQFVQQLGRI